MIYSRTTEYAIRALVALAKAPDGGHASVKTLAKQEHMPFHFLAKVLQQLTHKGLLRSGEGPQGGYALAMPADEICLLDIVKALDGRTPDHPGAGSAEDRPDGLYCAMHEEWVELQNEILDYLKDVTVAGLARSVESKQRALAEEGQAARRGVQTEPGAGPASVGRRTAAA